jgi:AraC-like DNA-binding protein
VFGKPSKLTIEQKTIVENFISKIKSEGYLFDNYDKILKDTGYCKLHFNRIFKEYSGVTIAQYIKEKRIEVAKKLLTDTDKTVEEVCVEVGYKDTANFYQIFKSATGISPRQFCKRNKRI